MGIANVSAGGADREASEPSATSQPRLLINGVEVKAKAIAELRDGVTVKQAAWITENDRLDEVFFEAAGKRYVAYGQGMKLPRAIEQDIQDKSYTALFGKVPATILHVDNQMNTAGEGAIEALKYAAIYTLVRLGVLGAGVGASRLSESVAGIVGKMKGITREGLEIIARKTGTRVPIAGIAVAGILYAADIGLGALIGSHRQPDEARIREITK